MASAARNKTYSFKLVLLGDSSVGKSSTVERFVKGEFFEFRPPTIGAAYMAQSIALNDCTVKLEIWDTAGQERYRALAPMYYRNASAALVVYDITSRDSFAGAKSWVDELKSRISEPDVIMALVGNKTDLDTKREVAASEASKYASELGCLWFEASAKTGDGVHEIFEQIARKLSGIAVAAGTPGIEKHDDNDPNALKGVEEQPAKLTKTKCCK